MPTRIRILLDLALLASFFILPWWFVVCACFIMLWFADYWEIIIVGALLDALYGKLLFALLAYIVFVVSLYLKPRLTFYTRL